MAKLILGLTGEMGCGKGSVAKHLVQNYDAGTYKFSQAFRDILDRVHLEQSRDNISALSLALRKTFGEDVLSKSMYHDVHNDPHEIVVIDGVRRIEDVELLKQLPEFRLVYIEADMETCYERLVRRGENEGDSTKSYEQFKQEHELDADARIRDLKNYADYVLENNGTYAEFYASVDAMVKSYLGDNPVTQTVQV